MTERITAVSEPIPASADVAWVRERLLSDVQEQAAERGWEDVEVWVLMDSPPDLFERNEVQVRVCARQRPP